MSDKIRKFKTGATRNLNEDKLAYDGFLSPLAQKRFAEYMHSHRKQADGSIRAADNWQQGIPQESYMESMYRHFMDVWFHNRGYSDLAEEDLETALAALMFNVQGMLHEILKAKRVKPDIPESIHELSQGHLHSLAIASQGFTPLHLECFSAVDEEESRLP